MFGKFLGHAWSWCGGFNKKTFYIGLLARAKLILTSLAMTMSLAPMNRYRVKRFKDFPFDFIDMGLTNSQSSFDLIDFLCVIKIAPSSMST